MNCTSARLKPTVACSGSCVPLEQKSDLKFAQHFKITARAQSLRKLVGRLQMQARKNWKRAQLMNSRGARALLPRISDKVSASWLGPSKCSLALTGVYGRSMCA